MDFVSLLGHAGTGKTLLTLAAALAQTLEQRRYSEIIMTRQTVPVGEDIGFLPGTEEEKMGPWMGALEDNLDVLQEQATQEHGAWGRAATHDLLKSRIRIKSLNFMRGRTFLEKIPHHRRGPKPEPAPDQNAGDARRAGQQDRLPRQHRPD